VKKYGDRAVLFSVGESESCSSATNSTSTARMDCQGPCMLISKQPKPTDTLSFI